MERFFINGGRRLIGEVEVECAKNALLPILAACVLVDGVITLKKVPHYSDVLAMIDILEYMGIKARFLGDDLLIDARAPTRFDFTVEQASKVRASIFLLGPLLARNKRAKVAYPGGCNIGLRPIDLHLKGLRDLGAKIVEKNGYIYADGDGLKGRDVFLEFPSVGATENLIMAAVLTRGTTRIINGAREPEIVDLQNLLNKCGASVSGAGSGEIIINGVNKLKKEIEYTAISDRIIAGTYMLAVAMCGGDITIKNTSASQNQALLSKLSESACLVDVKSDIIRIRAEGRLNSIGQIFTEVFPGYPTDLQPQTVAFASICKGDTVIIENLFESRFKHVSELRKMGADIQVKGNICMIHGREKLYGADVFACDLRAGAGLTLAGLVAEGYTHVYNVEHIDRGYFHIEQALANLGADIKREEY